MDKTKKELSEVLAENLAYYMKKTKITKTKLAKEIDVTYVTISHWLAGIDYPRIEKIERLALFFGINKSDLIEEHGTDIHRENDEIWEIKQTFQQRPDIKLLFDTSKNATEEDVKKTLDILNMIKS